MKKTHIEYLKFVFFLVIVLGLTPYLMNMVSSSWNTPLMTSISSVIKTVDKSGTSIFITFVIGFYIGSSILLAIDRRKRVQALILLLGVLVLFKYMLDHFTIGWNIIYIVIGIGVGIYLGTDFENRKETKKAASNISLFSVIYAAISMVILYLSPPPGANFIQDAIVLLVFAYFFGKVMSYEMKGSKIFILGPQQSGKTLFLAGCYKRVVDITKISTRRSDDLIELMKQIHQGWAKRTGEIKTYEFMYETGALFPRESHVRAIDYPGVYLEDIANYVGIESTDETETDIEKNARIKAAQEVTEADKLVFIIDCARYPHFDEMGIDYYLKIITKLREYRKDIKPYIVITKCDLFKDSYPTYEDDYDGFRDFVQSKFSENLFIRELMIESSNNAIYPVFYYTKKVELGEQIIDDLGRIQIPPQSTPSLSTTNTPSLSITNTNKQKKYDYIPIQDAFGNIHTYGFDRFMDDLIENE